MAGECGYAGLSNVVTREQNDVMPSYFFSETLKYLYLLFSDSPLASPTALKHIVFTTEGECSLDHKQAVLTIKLLPRKRPRLRLRE